MAYTTEAAVRAATGFSNTTNISSATVTAYIADADSVINSYIGDVYALPLALSTVATVPDIIETLSRHITTGLLYANEFGEESEDTDKGWKKRMDWAMGILEKIQKRKLKLRSATGVEYDRTSLKSPVFYPTDASSEADADDSTEPKITMNGKF